MTGPFRGILYPAKLPTFHRLPAPPAVSELVQWFWIPEWTIAPGRTSRQNVLAFAACNLVVQPGLVELSGPTTRVSHQDLTGTGWAVGALLKPAAVPLFTADPRSLRDARKPVDAPELLAAVVHAMEGTTPGSHRARAVAAFSAWLAGQRAVPSEEALLVNAMVDFINATPSVTQSDEIAAHFNVSLRTVQRLAQKYVGLGPAVLIRRRRLQEAAERVRTDPQQDLAAVAAEFGYTDQAHLCNDFQRLLGFTPGGYRRSI